MRVIITSLLVLVLSTLSAAEVISNPHFYSVTSPQGNESFLFGTLHGGVNIYDIPHSVIHKFNQSSTFILEWNFNDSQVAAILGGQIIEQQLKSFTHKGHDLSNSEKARLINDWGIDPRLAAKAKSGDCALLSFSGPALTGFMDMHFLFRARKQKKEIFYLDTKEHLDTLNKKYPSEKCDVRSFLAYVNPTEFKNQQLNFINDYRHGGVPYKTKEMTSSEERNLAWIPKLLTQIQKGNTFIAVGYLHLYGPYGLIELLEKNGYKVVRVR